MTKRLVYVAGCDDHTTVVMDLTDDEYAVVQRVAAAIRKEASRNCQPIMKTATEGEEHYAWPSEDEEED